MNKSLLFAIAFALLIGAGAGYLFARIDADVVPVAAQKAAERAPLFYRNPMNPEVTSPVPAKDSMGMDYIPVYADDGAGPMMHPRGSCASTR
jgi:Cu(I)/Ag(I) efflux system membrane fusion protein